MTDELDGAARMRGEQVFSVVRDILTNEAARVRGLEDAFIKIGIATKPDETRMAVVLGLEAAADIVTAIIAAGQEIALRKAHPPPWAKGEHDKKKWLASEFSRVDELLKALAGQARAALTAEARNKERIDERAGGDG